MKSGDRVFMEEKIAVITDSCADIPEELARENHIFVIPIRIICSDGEYRDGVDIHPADVYERLKTELPKSSTPSGADVEDVFEQVRAQGYHKAVALMLSGGLSSTANHVRLLAEELDDLEIKVYDSRTASIGTGVIALQAAEYVREGMGFEELKKACEGMIANTTVFFSLNTLEYLYKGGRIGKATALVGTLLDIKPILSIDEDGELYAAAKVRTRKAVEKRLIQLVEEHYEPGRPFNLVVADGGSPEARDELEQKLREHFPGFHALYRSNIGAALSVYIGSGILGAGIQYLDGK